MWVITQTAPALPAKTGWRKPTGAHDPLAAYVANEAAHHVRAAWDLGEPEGAGDAAAVGWLDDFPRRQDVVRRISTLGRRTYKWMPHAS